MEAGVRGKEESRERRPDPVWERLGISSDSRAARTREQEMR